MRNIIFGMFIFVIAGCATIMQGSRQEVGISSSPTNAIVTINGGSVGNTPVTVDLKRKDQQRIRVDLPGYQPYEITLTRSTSGWVWGNIIFGGIPGLVIDLATGSLYQLNPEQIQANLRSELTMNNEGLYIYTVLEPNLSWQKIGSLEK